MPKRREIVVEQLGELRQDFRDLWIALSADPKKEARKERAWSILAAGLGAGATMAARRATARVWGVITGEQPPTAPPAPTADRRTGSSDRR
jgi:hypothetical protein